MFLHTDLNFELLVYPLLSLRECMFLFKAESEARVDRTSSRQAYLELRSGILFFYFEKDKEEKQECDVFV